MIKLKVICSGFLIFFTIFALGVTNIRIVDLSCEYRNNPLGIAEKQPRLSWKMESNVSDQKQMAYQILVASTPEKLNEEEADLWNSGRVNSDQSVAVSYRGEDLNSMQKVYWKVKIWDREGNSTAYSAPGYWEMALLQKEDWQAKWIRHPDFLDDQLASKPAPFFRKEFSTKKKISSARAYVTGLGYFEMYLNGKKVGDHVLDPVKTRYDKAVNYLVFDIGEYLNEGKNAAGLILGTGWYNHFAEAAWQFNMAPWRSYPVMLCQIEIEYNDGSRDRIISDQTWRTTQGPILFDGIRNGEHYDARKEMPGWNKPLFSDISWENAVEVSGPSGELRSQQMPAIKEMIEIKPVSITEIKPGIFVFDLGQNIAGYSRLKVAGPAGTEITLKHGERLHPDGSVEQKQILRFLRSGEAQTDRYILKGEGVEEWNPRFVYHGYQYVEVTGLPVNPSAETLTGVVIYSAFNSAGDFACSNPLFNRIQEITRWSYVGNYHGVPTDCPHREKIGWTGDGHLVAEAGLYNYNTLTSYIKWLDDHVDEQKPDGDLPGVIPTSGWGYEHGKDEATRHLGYGPSWEGSIVLIPWYLYNFTGDTALLQRYYQPGKKYLNHLERNADSYLLNFGIDDHKAFYTKTEGDIIASGYFYFLAELFSTIAEILGNTGDSRRYDELAGNIKKAFQEEYYHSDLKTFGNGGQTSLSQGIYMNLVPEQDKNALIDNLLLKIDSADYHFDAGVGGVKSLFETLDRTNNNTTTYKMLNQTDFPSYGYWIEQGANTLWQDWDGSMSLNHVMFGSVSEWFFQSLAGINPDPEQPGFKNILLKPSFIQDLNWVKADYESPYGKIVSGWERKDGEIVMQFHVPVNSTATLVVPEGYRITEHLGKETESNTIQFSSGEYLVRLESL